MTLTMHPNLSNSLQTAFPRGTPFDHQELTTLVVSSGWLARLGLGVLMFPKDTLRREDCLTFLWRRMLDFHVGGKTALSWRDLRDNLLARTTFVLG
jgi:hypothetical protein